MIGKSEFVIAHNASFDRPHFDRMFPQFEDKLWCCSQRQVPWSEFGYDSQRQTYIALMMNFFYEEHKARTDCLALIEILSRKLGDKQVLSYLIETLDKNIYYVSAHNSDFLKKPLLKERNYLWEMANGNSKQVWAKAVTSQAEAKEEMDFLSDVIYTNKPNVSTCVCIERKDFFKESK